MFNLLVSGSGWAPGRDTMLLTRAFEYTAPDLVARFKPDGVLAVRELVNLPAIFVEESSRNHDPVTKVGTISRISVSGREVALGYSYDAEIPGLLNSRLKEIRTELGIDESEFTRTHWAVKDADLYYVLLVNQQPRRSPPRVFTLSEPEAVEPELMSAMMPFDPRFDAVYAALRNAGIAAGLRCRRADDIWENPAVIQDVVSLIDKSSVVVCDCTGRNPNVFYEIGIAHTLGREVILITQSDGDIPFDLRHLRYVKYLNNGEGLAELQERLAERLIAVTT